MRFGFLLIIDGYDVALWVLWAVVVAVTLIVMARDGTRRALHDGKRALKIVALGALAMFALSAITTLLSGYYHLGPHSGDSFTFTGFVVWTILRLVVPFPAWFVIALIGLLIWGSRPPERST